MIYRPKMRAARAAFAALFAVLLASTGLHGAGFITDPDSPELRRLAQPLEIDESEYGCGPMDRPANTYYVSLSGSDESDGTSWQTAWRTVHFGVSNLRAGDTLIIGEGEYLEREIQINVLETTHAAEGTVRPPQIGEPGRPIRIMAAPGHRVVLTGATTLDGFRRTPGTGHTYERVCTKERIYTVWESGTQIMLQWAGSVERVDELPGTYFLDPEACKLYVRFTDDRRPSARSVRVRGPRVGLRIHGSYVHVKGLWFTNYGSAIYCRPNEDRARGIKTHGDHITVEDCAFFANDMAGLHVSAVKGCLFKNNYGRQNGTRGSILMQNADLADNLFVGNVLESSEPTVRTHGGGLHYALNNYGGSGRRNHIVDNLILDRTRAFRCKPALKESVLQGNVFLGTFYSTRTLGRTEEDRVVVRNNTFLGPISWWRERLGPTGASGDWAAPEKAFINNFHTEPGRSAESIEDARFVDPAYADHRLQSDSPLIGGALGGGNRGAFRVQTERILYVSPEGDDGASGTSQRRALKTLRRAASMLRPGDTLYLLPGVYSETLTVAASGLKGRAICVRAHGKGQVQIPNVVLTGSHLTVEGITVPAGDGIGVLVEGDSVSLKDCRITGRRGSGIHATRARHLSLRHCTVAGNGTGLRLRTGSSHASIRDCIIANNRKAQLAIDEHSRRGFTASHNVYFGPGMDGKLAATEVRSVFVDPLFVDAGKADYRLRWDSPAARVAAFAAAAGSEPVRVRPIEVSDVRLNRVGPHSAVATWSTPLDDTRGSVQYRVRDEGEWESVADPEWGTVHGAGLVDLRPQTEYEFRVVATGRRGGTAQTDPMVLRTAEETPGAAIYYLAPDGNDSANGLSQKTAWRTIRRACQMVGPGDTVLIAPGVYRHAIVPFKGGTQDRRITFRRNGNGVALIDGGGAVAPLVRLVSKSHITIGGLTFDGIPEVGQSGGVFNLSGCTDIEMLNCRVGVKEASSWRSGNLLSASDCQRLLLEGNVSWGNSYHIRTYDCSGIVIKNNTFVNSTMIGCVLSGGDDIALLNNIWYRPCIPGKSNQAVMLRGTSIRRVVCDHNLYYSPYEHHKIGIVQGDSLDTRVSGDDLEQWRTNSGYDAHSIQAAPLFVDVEAGDFRLRPGSPAIGAGTDRQDIGALGVAGDESQNQ